MIFHIHNDSGYAQISNALLNDKLSIEAIGLVCYLLSRPHDWRVVPNQLRTRFGLGRDKLQRIMRELVVAGYARKRQRRDKLTKRWDGSEYDIYGMPQKPSKLSRLASRVPEKPAVGKPVAQDTQTNRLLRGSREGSKKNTQSQSLDSLVRVKNENELAGFDDFETLPGRYQRNGRLQ